MTQQKGDDTVELGVEVRELRKRFPVADSHITAVDAVSFGVTAGKFFTLLGPSGCGKTTTMRMLAGLERPDGGVIRLGGRVVYSHSARTFVPPNRRAIGMVFQSYAVWPHMTVFDNVAYPLAVRRLPRSEIRSRVADVLGLVGLEGLGQRPAPQLSGGQQQRVALARALVAEPDVLLLDEPLSNLDAQLRKQMREELKRLQNEVGVTTVYVTHDQEEALSMSDELMIMNRGQAVQYGTPLKVYHQPADHFAATFVGSANFLPGSALDGAIRPGQNRLETPIGTLLANASDASVGAMTGDVCIRPEAISLVADDGTEGDFHQDARPEGNHYSGVVLGSVFLGDRIDYEVRLGETRLRARAASTAGLSAGQAVRVQIPARYCTILPSK